MGFSKRQSGRFGTFAAACLIALFALGGTASAAPFTVTKTDDTNDGTCDSDCSLREAIAAANTNGEDDTITVPAGTYSIGSALNVGEASTTTTIAGANARSTVIDASGSGDRVFLFTGAAVLSHVTVSGGSNGNGGGIDASTVNLKLSDTTVKSNYAYSSGGGVLQSGGTLTVERSTFSGNQAESDGAAIDTQGGTLTVTNSTFDSNTSDANGGCVGQGAINVDSGTLNLTNDTITNNTNLLGTCSIPTGGVSFTGPTTSSVVNTIIANNTADAGSTPNCSGALTSTGHNIESGTDCGFTGTGDQQSTDPKLGALKDNGGETDTRAPNSDSPAIDAGDDTACPSTDQRGSYRPSGLQCDIGAFEVFGPLSTDPASPANENNPKVIGNAPTGWDVTLYTDSGCTSAVAGTGTAAEFASPGIAVTVDDNSTTTFYASATDPSDSSKTTGCSVASVTYVEDSIPPDPPTVSATDPASPANDNQPEVKGSAEDNSTVKIYTNSTCTSTVVGSGDAATFASPGITATVTPNTTTRFYATATDQAGNVSNCSTTSVKYVDDEVAPEAPTFSVTEPASPSNVNTPKIRGASEGVTVKLYTNDTCTSAVAGSGTPGAFNAPGLSVTVGDDSTTTFWATATDSAGNASDCSTDSITYVEDSTPPDAPSGLSVSPASPANDNDPKVQGTAPAGTTVKIYSDDTCTTPVSGASGSDSAFGGAGITAHVPNDSSTTFYATATDSAGNESDCSTDSADYVEDSTKPTSEASSPSSSSSPSIDVEYTAEGTGSPLTQVELYVKRPGDSDFSLADTDNSPSASGEHFTYTADQGDGDYAFYTRAYDSASNAEDAPASADTTTTLDTTTPPAPDTTPPAITIEAPVADKSFVEGATPKSSYSCSDAGGSGVASCAGPAPSGADIDTDKVGVHDFTVNAMDKDGNKSSKTVQYRVLSRGIITVTSKPKATLENGRITLDTGLTGYCPLAGPDCVGLVTAHRASSSQASKAALSSDRFGHAHLRIHGASSKKLVYRLGKSRSKQLERLGKIRLRLNASLNRGTNRFARRTKFVTVKFNR